MRLNAKRFAKRAGLLAGLALLPMIAMAPSAGATTVQSLNSAWQLLPGSLSPSGGTWGLPANLSALNCGSENETDCEPTGDFIFSQALTGPLGFYVITDDDGGVGTVSTSDIIILANSGPGGVGELLFYSDPNLNVDTTPYSYLGILCQELSDTTDPTGNGCSGFIGLTFADNSTAGVLAASDTELVFDPFGFNFDSSDQIQFRDLTPTGIPEPGTLALFGGTLLGLGFLRRRKAKK